MGNGLFGWLFAHIKAKEAFSNNFFSFLPQHSNKIWHMVIIKKRCSKASKRAFFVNLRMYVKSK